MQQYRAGSHFQDVCPWLTGENLDGSHLLAWLVAPSVVHSCTLGNLQMLGRKTQTVFILVDFDQTHTVIQIGAIDFPFPVATFEANPLLHQGALPCYWFYILLSKCRNTDIHNIGTLMQSCRHSLIRHSRLGFRSFRRRWFYHLYC